MGFSKPLITFFANKHDTVAVLRMVYGNVKAVQNKVMFLYALFLSG